MKPRLTIIGLGRIGASAGLALKKNGAELEIIGHDKQRDAIGAAQKMGAVDRGEWNLYNACEGAGLILLSMPLAGVLETINLLKDDVPAGVIVSDTASVKEPVLNAAKAFQPGVHFIGGHPVFHPAPDGSLPGAKPSAELFQNAVYCLTPTADSAPDAVQIMTGFTSILGAKPLYLDPAEHDGLAAGAQHLATVLQIALLKATTASGGWRELNKFAGDDYYQATQLATRDADSTTQMLLSQRVPLQAWIDQTTRTLGDLKALLAQNDTDALEKWLKAAQDARRLWLANQVGATDSGIDYSEVRSGTARMFLGGLATRFGGDKKK